MAKRASSSNRTTHLFNSRTHSTLPALLRAAVALAPVLALCILELSFFVRIIQLFEFVLLPPLLPHQPRDEETVK